MEAGPGFAVAVAVGNGLGASGEFGLGPGVLGTSGTSGKL